MAVASSWSWSRRRILVLSFASRSAGSIEEASAETVWYHLVIRRVTVLWALAISAPFFAVLVPREAYIGDAYNILLLTTVASSALLICKGPPRFGISLFIANTDSMALCEVCCMCSVNESRVSI